MLSLLINTTVRSSRAHSPEIMPYPTADRKAGTKTRKVAHAKILTASLHKLQLEAREAVAST